jgi:phosphoglycolate phosphatase-like HAD superfamily hydrolase
MEILKPVKPARIKAALFDFDGTLSTLRCGWEQVMRPLMIEMIGSNDVALAEEVDKYIDESTGIQTAHQMEWLRAKAIERKSKNVLGVWEYKDEYNRRLARAIKDRLEALESGTSVPADFMIAGSREFLSSLNERGVKLYLASGTDHCDMSREAELLGLSKFFSLILGAPEREKACSKEAVMRRLIEKESLCANELAVIGDGKVEIALAAESGSYPIGVASDEVVRRGVSKAKRNRLAKAGASVIIGDFLELDDLLELLSL